MKITNNFNINTYSFQAKKKNPPEIVNAQTPIEQEVSPHLELEKFSARWQKFSSRNRNHVPQKDLSPAAPDLQI